MKKKQLGLCLLLGILCLGACSPRNGGESKEETTEDAGTKETGEEDDGEEDDGEERTGETKEDEDEAKTPSKEIKKPQPLLLLTAREYDHVWEDGRHLSYVTYPKIWLDDRSDAETGNGASAFPQLAKALNDMNAQTGEAAGEIMAKLEATAREMNGAAQELSWEEDVWVIRADSQVLSLLERNFTYLGGAHGDYGYTGITFDSESGRQMELEEIVTDRQSLMELVADRVVEKYQDVDFFGDPKETIEKELEEGYSTWVVGYEGITFYFDPYELAPYAYGTQTVTVLYKEAPELFDSRICQVPGSWAVQIVPGMEFDLGNDGTLDTVEVNGIMDEYGSAYEKLQVVVNGQETTRDMWIYQYNSYLLHKENLDTELLVTLTSSDNDYQVMVVHELDPDKEGFRNPWQFSGTGLSSYYDEMEDGTVKYGTWILTDPEHFPLETRYNLLSTYSGNQWCGVDETAGSGGYLVLDHPWMDVDRGEYYLTLLVPLEMETGETKEPQMYPAGTKLWIIRVEKDDCVVFRTEDHTTCRVYLEPSGWSVKVRGAEDMAVEDIFDGMMFAG